MTQVSQERDTCLSVPYLHRLIGVRRGNTGTIRRPCHPIHPLITAARDPDRLACESVPYLYRFVHANRSDACSIGGPCHSGHNAKMTSILKKAFPPSTIPKLPIPIKLTRS